MSHLSIINSQVVQAQLRTDIPEFKTGSTVDVYYKIQEGGKERIQVYSGIVIARKHGSGIDATFTVLKNSTAGIKVERTFPLHSPMIDKVVVTSELKRARKSKLYHLRKLKDPVKSVRTKVVKPTVKVEAA